jgi:hypothetical protein
VVRKVSTLGDYVDLVKKSGAEVLGSILWFSITGEIDRSDGKRTIPVRISHDQLAKLFGEIGLDEDFIPAPPRKVHAFRTACSETRRVYKLPVEGESVELLIREVTHDAEKRIHHIMREHKDSRGERLSYTHAATLKFYRGGRTAGKNLNSESYTATILRGLDPLDEKQIEAMIHEFDAKYTDLSANLHSQVIRSMLRRYLESLNAIKVRPSGGIYFIHSSKQDTVDALSELVSRLGVGCTFFQTPLPDIPASREMLTDAFQDEVEDDVRDLLGEIADYNEKLKGKPPSEVKYGEFRTRYEQIMERASEYSEVLGLQQERAGVALEMALDQVTSIGTAMLQAAPKRKRATKATA